MCFSRGRSKFECAENGSTYSIDCGYQIIVFSPFAEVLFGELCVAPYMGVGVRGLLPE